MKKCPYCAEQIQDDAIKCRYCGSMLSGSAEPSTIRAADGMHERVRQLARSGQVIEAIKVVREQTGLGLKEAKEYVERLEPNAPKAKPPVGCLFAGLLIVAVIAGLVFWLLATFVGTP